MNTKQTVSERIINCWISGTPCPETRELADAAPKLLSALKRLAAIDSPDYGRKLIAGEVHDIATAAISKAYPQSVENPLAFTLTKEKK